MPSNNESITPQIQSKSPVSKPPRKSLIPIRSSAHSSRSSQSATGHPAKKKSLNLTTIPVKCEFRRSLKSIHSLTIPIDELDESGDDLRNAPHNFEGSLPNPFLTLINPCSGWIKHENSLLLSLAVQAASIARNNRGYFCCPICSEPFSRPVIISCGHMHCMECISNWFDDQDSCPCCRFRVINRDSDESPFALDFYQSGTLLASVFKMATAIGENSRIEPKPSKSTAFDEALMGSVARILGKCLPQVQAKGRKEFDPTWKIEQNSFTGAIWLVKKAVECSTLDSFKNQLEEELQNGDDSRRESFIKKIMSMKTPNRHSNEDFLVPSLSLINPLERNVPRRETRFRFKWPGTDGICTFVLAAIIFTGIFIAVCIFEGRSGYNETLRMETIVYIAVVLSMATLTNGDRFATFRRRLRPNRH